MGGQEGNGPALINCGSKRVSGHTPRTTSELVRTEFRKPTQQRSTNTWVATGGKIRSLKSCGDFATSMFDMERRAKRSTLSIAPECINSIF